MALYTKTGDHGTTQLGTSERVPKYDLRVEAYGTADELGAHVALLCDMIAARKPSSPHIARLREVLSVLMSVQGLLAGGRTGYSPEEDLPAGCIRTLEEQIDAMSSALPPLRNFTIPGGDVTVSQCHVCRTVCRRAERRAVQAAAQFPMPHMALTYLNRLSDWFYILGRTLSGEMGAEEILWHPSQKF